MADQPTRRLGSTELQVFPVCLGGNIFGWTASDDESHAVLDAFVGAGGNFIDTANSYMTEHGRSETIIGQWLGRQTRRNDLVVATKVGGGGDGFNNLRPNTIEAEAHASLSRLQTTYIDVYYAHFDDAETPMEESLVALDALVQAGLVRHLGLSNYSPDRLDAAVALQRRLGLAEFTVLQAHYNLVERSFEQTLAPVAQRWDLAVLPYFSLAQGFLTGKYRSGQPTAGETARATGARRYSSEDSLAVLDVLDSIAGAHNAAVSTVALAWLLTRPLVVAPVTSARNQQQLDELIAAATLELSEDELDRLEVISGEVTSAH